MSNIGDVAREAGVSRSTVSAVLTGRKRVSPETRQRIEAAIAELNFTANSGARALATSRTMVIGLVVQIHAPEFSPALAPWVFALSDAARNHGYEVLLMTENDSVAAIMRAAQTRRVDGLILLSVVEDDVRFAALNEVDVPAVLLGLPKDSRGIDAVDLDFAFAARQLLRHLFDFGHRDVLFVKRSRAMFERGFAFVHRFSDTATTYAHELGMTLREFSCPEQPEELPDALASALRERGGATALLVHDDAAAVLLPMATRMTGLRVPDDLSVVSLHSTELALSLALPYTFIESDSSRVSASAVAALLRRIDAGGQGVDEPVLHELAKPRLTERGSVSRPSQSL